MRGIGAGTLFGIIIAIVVFMFGAMVIGQIKPASYADASLCSGVGFSLRMFSMFDGVTVASPDDPTGILKLCPPRLVTISGSKPDSYVNRRLTEEMLLCDKSFGGSKVNLFQDAGRGTQTRYCGLCSKIDFEKNSDTPITGLGDYLSTTEVPGTHKSAAEILNGDLPPSANVQEIQAGGGESVDSGLTRADDLAVLYIYDKNASLAHNGWEAFGYGALAGVGIKIGAKQAGERAVRAVAAKVAIRTAERQGGARVVGLLFGPAGWAIEAAATGVMATAGGVAAVSDRSLYTDKYAGGVMIIPWNLLVPDVPADWTGDLGPNKPDAPDGLYKSLGCQIPVGFVRSSG